MRVVVVASKGRSLLNFRGPLLRAMRAVGHEVIAMAPPDHPGLEEGLAAMGVRFRPLELQRTGMNPVADAAALRSLVAALRAERPDVVFAYTIKPVIYAGVAARLARVPRSVALITGLGHVFVADSPRMRVVRRAVCAAYRAVLAGADVVFFQNPDDRAEFVRRRLVDPDKTVLVAGSGVDLAHYPRSPVPVDPVTFVFVGRFLVEKGVRELVDAVRLVRARGHDVRIRLVGATDANPSSVSDAEVAAWVDEGLVDLVGWVEDVRPWLRDSSVMVLPSWREGTPRSVLEGLATGRAVITTDAPGCRETVVDGLNGFLVPLRDPEALADRMARFVDDPGLAVRMGEAGYRLAEEKYDVNKVNAVMLSAMGLA
jgi:glycosyltransferase involved in cell wall biosynthesis